MRHIHGLIRQCSALKVASDPVHIPQRESLTYDNPCNCPVAEAMVAGGRGRAGAGAASSFLGKRASLLQQGPAVRRIVLWHPLLYLSHPLRDWRPGRACTSTEKKCPVALRGPSVQISNARPLPESGW